ncbi:MAG TPA: outer membrane beta-barrel protein [Thermoanaerobaculia bacterium]|nr:outer membrane beta-barrel protein [Thermoanaerobaculia bacterium]
MLFAQDWRQGRRDRYDRYPNYDNRFELTPFVGYTWGGTIYSDVTDLFGEDVQSSSAANYGINFGIPLGNTPLKLDLMVSRQDTDLTSSGGGLFQPDTRVANFHVTYYHGGLMIPFNQSRSATPYVIISAGVANLDPSISGVSPSNRFSAAAGIGVKVPVNNQLGVRLETRGYFTSLGGNNNNNNHCYRCYDSGGHDFYQGQVNLGFVISF